MHPVPRRKKIPSAGPVAARGRCIALRSMHPTNFAENLPDSIATALRLPEKGKGLWREPTRIPFSGTFEPFS